MHRFGYALGCAVAIALASTIAISGQQGAKASEVEIRAAGPWPSTTPLTQSFFRFIEKANEAGKGLYRIRYIGGPEITQPPQQPTAMRNGLIDMLYGPPAYYLGTFPEGDFAYGFRSPMEQRANGAYDLIRPAMKQKMNARFMARFDSGVGLYLFLADEPRRTASGGIDLTGLTVRGSPAYRDFIREMGGTAVVMGAGDVYSALERGVINGAGFSINDIRTRGLEKFLKYRIDPPFSFATISLVMNHDKWDALSPEARAVLDKQSTEWERESRQYWLDQAEQEKAELAKLGMQTVTLEGEQATAYQALFLKGPWDRMMNNRNIKIDVKKLKELAY